MNIQQSELLFERSKKLVPGGVHSPVRGFRGVGGTPRFIQSAQGAELIDVDGNRYIDFCLSWGPLIFGHQDPEIREAVHSALNRGWSYGATEPYSLELAEEVTRSLPWVEKIRFVSSGTEAVMAALRLARAATGRHKILKFDGCYHGHVDSMLVRAGSGLADMGVPDSAGVSAAVASETIVAPLDDLQTLENLFALHGSEIAAAIVEPIPANNGLLPHAPGFLERLAELCKKAGSLLIFDEVITGFRVAFGGMAEVTGIRPDLLTYGKIIGAGFPAAAYGGRADLMDLIAPVGPVYQAGTLSASPVAMSAGLAMLKKLKKENPYPLLESKMQKLSKSIEGIAQKKGATVSVQSHGSIFWLVFGEKKDPEKLVRTPSQAPENHKAIHSQSFHRLLNQGIYCAPSAFEVSFLSTAHSDEQLDYFLQSFEKALQ